ncbi:MAG: GNAT family N-acetyltransferase [Phycisphaerales bacterium]|jgi:hypothetical protein
MCLGIDVVDPTKQSDWDDTVTAVDGWTLFHTAAWARVLGETYQYRPLYFTARDEGRLLAAVPMMEVDSSLTGRRGVSLPFTDYCSPLVADAACLGNLGEFVLDYGRKAGWKSIEFRGEGLADGPASASFYRHTLDLTPGVEQLFANLKDTTRRNVRKAMREGVTVSMHDSLEAVREYYRLHCMTRKKHGVPPQPVEFFDKIHEHIIGRGLGVVALASYNGVHVAGDVFFGLGGKALYKFGASDYAYQQLRPSDLVMWESIQWHAERKYRSLCFGRTEFDNEGLRRFKNQWGTTEQLIHYRKYDLRRDTFITNTPQTGGSHHRFFHAMPIPVLRVFGSLLYKHMG